MSPSINEIQHRQVVFWSSPAVPSLQAVPSPPWSLKSPTAIPSRRSCLSSRRHRAGPWSSNLRESSPQTACRGGPWQWPLAAARRFCRLTLAPPSDWARPVARASVRSATGPGLGPRIQTACRGGRRPRAAGDRASGSGCSKSPGRSKSPGCSNMHPEYEPEYEHHQFLW